MSEIGIDTYATERRIQSGVMRGEYELMAIGEGSVDTTSYLIWYNNVTKDVIREELGDRNKPFKEVVLDFDGTFIDSEGEGGYFAVCWRRLFRDAGMTESDKDLASLRHKIYIWNGTLERSTLDMVGRIQEGVGRDGTLLQPDEHSALKKLIEPDTILRWAQMNKRDYGPNPLGHSAEIIADRKEIMGKQLLAYNPSLVLQLAPFTPGSVDFIKAIPDDVIVGIASGSRVETTILPILKAHAIMGNPFVLKRVGPLIAGEDNLLGNHAKPHRRYYEAALITIAQILKGEGKIPPGGIEVRDIVYIGDRIAKGSELDMPSTRKRMSHVAINAGPKTNNLGPFAAVASDFSALNQELRQPPDQIRDPILSRLANTISLPAKKVLV